MLSLGVLLVSWLGLASAHAKPQPGCGELDIIFTGLPPYHPLVSGQGFNSTLVDKALHADAANIIAAGYNLKVVLFGPEQPISVLAQQMHGHLWAGTGVGYGVRGSQLPNLTIQLEETIDVYRKRAPQGYVLFNYSPTTSLWAVQQRFPLSSNCTNSPGTNYGIVTICDICSQPT